MSRFVRVYHATRTFFLNGGEFEVGIDPYAELKTKRQAHGIKIRSNQSKNWNKRNNYTKIVNGKRIPAEMSEN